MIHRYLLASVKIHLAICLICISTFTFSQGTWTALRDTAPNYNAGVMILLTDGSVMVKTVNDSTSGRLWNKLTPDATGSYINGTWSTLALMRDDRWYFSSQVLQNGKVYVAGGEYGVGNNTAELYDPVADTWTPILAPGDGIGDANSKMLPDGRVLQNIVLNSLSQYGVENLIYDPVSNSYSTSPLYDCLGGADESCWNMQPDNSILCLDWNSFTSERYIPSMGHWVPDALTPLSIYDVFANETGPGILLPDGRTFYLGGDSTTLFYTPSGDSLPGTWAAGPPLPDGLGAPDACASMMPNGHILFGISPAPNDFNPDSLFRYPTYFYEFDYTNNSYTPVWAPDGMPSMDIAAYMCNMVNLPDGSILYSTLMDNQYYIYTPAGAPLAAGKPTISGVHKTGCEFMITGTLFNGISEGSTYGDDWQMSTNYPIVRLSAGGHVYYARTHDWNRIGLQTGSLPDTAYFTLPWSVPDGSYNLLLSANGISSDPFNFSYISCTTGIKNANDNVTALRAYPNPTNGSATLAFTSSDGNKYKIALTDLYGRSILEAQGQAVPGDNSYKLDLRELASGIYTSILSMDGQNYATRITVE